MSKWYIVPTIVVVIVLHISMERASAQLRPEGATIDVVKTEPPKVKIARIFIPGSTKDNEKVPVIGLGEALRFELQVESRQSLSLLNRKLILFINDRPFKDISGTILGVDGNICEVLLERTVANRQAWTSILGQPNELTRSIKMGLGFEDGLQFAALSPEVNSVKFVVMSSKALWVSLVGMLIVLGLFIWFSIKSDILRDWGPCDEDKKKRRPYSLAKIQMAFWVLLIFASFVFLILVTRDHHTMTSQALILMGLGAGTALGATVIDGSKQTQTREKLNEMLPKKGKLAEEIKSLNERTSNPSSDGDKTPDAQHKLRAELGEKEAEVKQIEIEMAELEKDVKPAVTRGITKDVLVGKDGVGLHRFQVVIWTVLLGALFVYEVWSNLSMPEFDNTLLALMGISAGAYLGFKIPER
jgi:hypothetical protein